MLDPAEEQIVIEPLIGPGAPGPGLTVTESIFTAELPQEFTAVTLTFPLDPAVALIVLVVEDPDQPPGKVQL